MNPQKLTITKQRKNLKRRLSLIMYLLITASFASEECQVDSNELLSQLVTNYLSIKMSEEMIKRAQERIDAAEWGYSPTPSLARK